MRQPQWVRPIIVIGLATALLGACSPSADDLPTPTSAQPTATSMPPTAIVLPPTGIPTPAPLISVDTVSRLAIFTSFGKGHVLRSLAFTPDGTVLASMSTDNEDYAIGLANVVNGQLIGRLQGHTAIVGGLAFSPDGQMLASASSDGTAKIWDWRAGTLLKSLEFPRQVVSVAFSPYGQILAVGGVDESQNGQQNAAIWTFAVDSWEPLLKFPEFLNIPSMAFSPDGIFLVGGGASRNVQVWSTIDGASIFTLNHPHQVSSLVISPDGGTLATGTCETVVASDCTQGSIWLWDLPTGRLITQFVGFPEGVDSVAFSPDGSLLFAGSHGGTLRAYATSGYQRLFEATAPGGIAVLAVSPDGRLVATGGSGSGEVHLWSVGQ
jgi:WD40 repeat protein